LFCGHAGAVAGYCGSVREEESHLVLDQLLESLPAVRELLKAIALPVVSPQPRGDRAERRDDVVDQLRMGDARDVRYLTCDLVRAAHRHPLWQFGGRMMVRLEVKVDADHEGLYEIGEGGSD
jgi:hypothetical protein